MKKLLAILLGVSLLFSVMIIPSNAEDGKSATPSVPESVIAGEKLLGALGSVAGHLIKAITGVNESRVKKASVLSENRKKYETPLFDGEGEKRLSAETWKMIELTYESEKGYDDPFGDVTVDLLLYGNGWLYTVPGFWDGGKTWKIRFVCPYEGRWQFKTVCSDESNSSLHEKTGTIDCSAYSGKLDIYRHGFLTTRSREKYLTYDDGTPFFYLGDTHWNFGTEPTSVVEAVSQRRIEQGFTVWQSEPNGDFKDKYDLTNGVDEDDLNGLREFDKRYAIVAEKGLVHANAQFFFAPQITSLIEQNGGFSDKTISGRVLGKKATVRELSDEAKAYLEKLSRYWIARYGAYPVIWTLGQEVDNDFYGGENNNSQWNTLNNPFKLVAEYIKKYDPYTQPLTAHQESTGNTVAFGNGEGTGEIGMIYYLNGSPSAFRKVPSHTMYAAQWSPKLDGRDDYVSSKDYWYNGQGKPVVDYEGRYCNYWTKDFGSRMQGWASFLNGMCGYGWGAQGTWYYTDDFNPEPATFDGVDVVSEEDKVQTRWTDSLSFPCSYQVGYMRDFMEDIEWYDLVPRFNNLAYFTPCVGVYKYFASNKTNTEIVVYFYSFTDEDVAERSNTESYGGLLTGTVGSLIPFAKYNYKWFDPINGEYIAEGSFRASPIGTWFAGERPDDTDMVLLIQKAK